MKEAENKPELILTYQESKSGETSRKRKYNKYTPWQGYFEALEDVKVESFIVQ